MSDKYDFFSVRFWGKKLIYVTNITNIISGEKIVIWRNFRCLHKTYVKKSEILHIWHVCDVETVAIYAKFMQFMPFMLNLLFTLFCREIYFATIYVLLCREKLSPKVHLWRKNDKYQVCAQLDYFNI